MSDYSDVQRAVRGGKHRIWIPWLCASVIPPIAGRAVDGLGVVGMVIQEVVILAWIALMMVLIRMTGALNRKAAAARREVLGDDYPG
ncbi:hypothetical protein ACFYYI_09985 [Streptomyces sp. NPDC002387]|uniref:Integral membrane protein n=1 Tax=Streptomyces lannensis TaxID=766498 RepID=A0ABP7JVJ2_9ACTN|nr:hypothetical protein [Streptomyces sp. WAC07094]